MSLNIRQCRKCLFLLFVLLVGDLEAQLGQRTLKLTNYACTPNSKWIEVFNCSVKAQRGTSGKVYVSAKILLPIAALKLRVEVFKWASGWKPFLVNATFDVCKLLGAKNRNPLEIVIYQMVGKDTHFNRTCPFEGMITVPGVATNITKIPSLIDEGNYRIYQTYFQPALKEHIITIDAHVQLSYRNVRY